MLFEPGEYRITIRDRYNADGGGYATAHHSACNRVRPSSRVSEQHHSRFESVSDFTYPPGWTTAEAVAAYRRRWTVPIEVRLCACTGNLREWEA